MSYNPNDLLGGGAWTELSSVTISNQATVEFDLTGTYKMYMIHMANIVPANDDQLLEVRYSVDGGSSFFSGVSDYALRTLGISGTINAAGVSDAVSSMGLGSPSSGQRMGTAAGESLNANVYIHNARQANNATCFTSEISLRGSGDTVVGVKSGGLNNNSVDAVDAIQFFATSGNLSTGNMTLYGLGL
jgi:hypothetical protein